ncbi:MAG: hypothetical protein JWN66_1188 [Sphingomonas bacterium]|uniref:hypothetical protein n=1 Tax=Sphingomonas bacterium TaxID=1895847 RepID=UPI0026253813|nr:hypothetical protein [Sphingomonas bacterium]MDB5704072.1 hypothetical protein [Sphingomonas bacterium]
MRKITLAALALATALAMPATLSAKDNAGVVPLLVAPASLRPDAAYLLVKVSTAKSGLFPIQPVLLRIPSAQEVEAYRAAKQAAYAEALPKLTKKARDGKVPTIDEFEFDYAGKANIFAVGGGKFLEDGEMRTVLLELPPGDYIVYGSTIGGGGLVTCNCLGTIRFGARAGVITNLGALYADKVHKPSPVPHLEDNLGPSMFAYGFVFGQALVPADASTPVPAALAGLPVEPARIDIVGEYYEPGAGNINRLAPIPGILGYKRGRPVDLRTGKIAE